MAVTSSTGAGQKTEYAALNERQATLLLSYMRNVEVIRSFKIKLVKKFYEMAEEIRR
jgi:phage regulator Rha-like protein